MDRSWIRPTVLLCSFGVFIYVKPSEPFLTPFLRGPLHNLTEEEVVNQIYPVWTYSYLALLLPAFLLTDFLRYKPVILAQALGQVGCWTLLIFGRGVPLMQLMQFFYAMTTACEVAYFSYIYSVVDESHYQRVTSYLRSAILVGYLIASVTGQLLVSLLHIDLLWLNVISLASVFVAFVIACFLPMPQTTLFFYSSQREEGEKIRIEEPVKGTSFSAAPSLRGTLLQMWRDVRTCYTNATLLRWSVWWALSTCGWLLVVNYIQNLWESIRPSAENEVYNGAVDAAATALGALGAFGVGFLKVNWSKWGELTLGVFSLAKCGLLMAMYWTTNKWICYVAYVLFAFLYFFVITITQFQIAVDLTTSRFALVFGVNTFAAVGLNTVLTIILIDQAGLALDVNEQFIVYSGYFGIVAVIFFSHAIYALATKRRHGNGNVVVKSSL